MVHWFPSGGGGLVVTTLQVLGFVACNSSVPTWTQDVEPIVIGHCARCHEAGGIAPFPLGTYEDTHSMREVVAASVGAKTMPPWAAEGGLPLLHDASLTDDQIATVLAWVRGGAPEGLPSDEAPSVPMSFGDAVRVDQEISIPEPFTVPAGDTTRCFPVEWPHADELWVTGQVGLPDRSDAVHHVVLFSVAADSADRVREYDEGADGPGYPCYGGVLSDLAPPEDGLPRVRFLGDWAPGMEGTVLPEGTGIRMPPGQLPVLQVHYHHATGGMADQSSVGLRLESEVTTEGYYLPWIDMRWIFVPGAMNIPAGESESSVIHSFTGSPGTSTVFLDVSDGRTIEGNVKLWNVFPHMHLLGKDLRLSIERADGSEDLLIAVPRYDFRWQREYSLEDPVILTPEDQLRVDCEFGNSLEFRRARGIEPAEPRDVGFGESTNDEMCLAIVYVTAE